MPTSHSTSHQWAWLLWWLTCALAALEYAFLMLNVTTALPVNFRGIILYGLIYGAIGQYLARKRPQNAIGWLFLLFGFITGATALGIEYAAYGLVVHPGALPGGAVTAWITSWLWVGVIGTATFAVLLFPTGHLPSPRWRAVAWATAAVFALGMLEYMLKPGPLRMAPYLDNPFAIAVSAEVFAIFNLLAYTALALCQLAAAASVLVRFRHAGGIERQQLKWFAYTAGILMVVGLLQAVPATFNVAVPDWWNVFNILLAVTIVALPFSVALAILRYRLYDIDRVINRTLVYALLTLSLAAIYIGSVLLLRTIFRELTGEQPEAVTVLSTLLIAALFVPVRRRIQTVIDRRFNRQRYDAARTLAAFGVMVRDEVDLDRLSGQLLAVVHETMEPAHVSLWLKPHDPRGGQVQ